MIPPFTISGALPPFLGDDPALTGATSPYETTLEEVIERFGTSEDRLRILRGLITYRRRLREVGCLGGFQLLDGSFVEDAEQTRGRPPGDIDLITFSFLNRPASLELIAENADVFDQDESKRIHLCHTFFVDMRKDPFLTVKDTIYLFGLFSHQKVTLLWKGILAVQLTTDDETAIRMLEGL